MEEPYKSFVIVYNENQEVFIAYKGEVEDDKQVTRSKSLVELKKRLDKLEKGKFEPFEAIIKAHFKPVLAKITSFIDQDLRYGNVTVWASVKDEKGRLTKEKTSFRPNDEEDKSIFLKTDKNVKLLEEYYKLKWQTELLEKKQRKLQDQFEKPLTMEFLRSQLKEIG